MIHRFLLKVWSWLPLPYWIQWKLVSLWTPKYRVAVAAILLNEQGQILLCEHTYRRGYPWGLPGGSMQSREDPARAMQREIFEETGFSVRVVRPLIVKALQEHPQLSVIYLCLPTGGSFRANAEVSQIRFFDPHNLPERLLPTERTIIEQAFTILGENERGHL